MAKKYWKMIPHVMGFIVSDGQTNARSMEDLPIWNLSEVEFDDETGVIVCVDKKYQFQIITMLEEKESHYICI